MLTLDFALYDEHPVVKTTCIYLHHCISLNWLCYSGKILCMGANEIRGFGWSVCAPARAEEHGTQVVLTELRLSDKHMPNMVFFS